MEDEGDTIIQADPSLGIKMKVAWVSGNDKEPPKLRTNKPRMINNVGSAMVLVLDVVIAGLFTYIALRENRSKNARFETWNITTSVES